MIARFHYDDETLGRLLHDQPDRDIDEVKAHVEACEVCQDQLESISTGDMSWDDVCELMQRTDHPAFESSGDVSLPETIVAFLEASDEPHSIGRFGRYEIVEILGRGGMGIVMRGIDSALDRHCAIKVLSPELASSSAARKRFSREARSAAAVVHPHVVPIQTVDEHKGHPYLVMPVVEGRSLQQRVERNGPLQVVEVVRIAAQVAKGLSAAHSQGLVHRDIKPANVLLENDVERVQITDFGLARAVDDASMTRSGVIAGTPQYMSPEQSHGDTIDHRSDLFSLGSVMYFMLTGRSPFRAETSMGVLNRICNDEPRSLRSINADVPQWLESLVIKLLEKSPDDRFQSSEELANVLDDYLNALNNPQSDQLSKLIESQPVSKAHRSSLAKPPNRFRPLVLAAGFAFLALAGTIFYLQTDKGTLRIESNSDMDVPVRIMSGNETVEQLTVSKDGATTRLQAGNYVIEVDDADSHVEVKGDRFTLRRGDSWIVSITPVTRFRGAGVQGTIQLFDGPPKRLLGRATGDTDTSAGVGRTSKHAGQEVDATNAIRKRIQGRWRIDSVMEEGYDDLGDISEVNEIEIKGDVIDYLGTDRIKMNWIGPDRRVGAKEGAFAVDFGFDPTDSSRATSGIIWCDSDRLQMCYASEPYEQPFRPLQMKLGPHVILVQLSRIAGEGAATDDVASENDMTDTERAWSFFEWDGAGNVVIGQRFADQLELNDDQIVAVNQSLGRAWQSYMETERRNTTTFSRLDTGGIVAEIDDPSADLPRLRGRLRSELRSVVSDSVAEAIYSLAVTRHGNEADDTWPEAAAAYPSILGWTAQNYPVKVQITYHEGKVHWYVRPGKHGVTGNGMRLPSELEHYLRLDKQPSLPSPAAIEFSGVETPPNPTARPGGDDNVIGFKSPAFQSAESLARTIRDCQQKRDYVKLASLMNDDLVADLLEGFMADVIDVLTNDADDFSDFRAYRELTTLFASAMGVDREAARELIESATKQLPRDGQAKPEQRSVEQHLAAGIKHRHQFLGNAYRWFIEHKKAGAAVAIPGSRLFIEDDRATTINETADYAFISLHDPADGWRINNLWSSSEPSSVDELLKDWPKSLPRKAEDLSGIDLKVAEVLRPSPPQQSLQSPEFPPVTIMVQSEDGKALAGSTVMLRRRSEKLQHSAPPVALQSASHRHEAGGGICCAR